MIYAGSNSCDKITKLVKIERQQNLKSSEIEEDDKVMELIAWSSEQSGTGWRGNTQSARSLAKIINTLRPSWKGLYKAGLLNC